MRKFQPSYGVWPFDTIKSWVADDIAAIQSQTGLAIGYGPEVYQTLDRRFLQPPSGLLNAYEQAVYFLSLAAGRADYNNNSTAESRLKAAVKRTKLEQNAVQEDISMLCRVTGYGCSNSGATRVLDAAIGDIESSGLGPDDKTRILGYLNANRRGLMLKTAKPYLILGGIGLAIGGLVYWRKQKRSTVKN